MLCVLGDLGGNMGLLVGASVITVFELLDLFIYHAIVKLTKKKEDRRNSRQMSVENEPQDSRNDLNLFTEDQDSFANKYAWNNYGDFLPLDSSLPKAAVCATDREACLEDPNIASTYL